MTRLTRRDRKALELAYECARQSAEDALDALGHGGDVSQSLIYAGHPTMRWGGLDIFTDECRAWVRECNIYRARLALAIRVILRTHALDAWGDPRGDFGPTRDAAEVFGRCDRCDWVAGDEDPVKRECPGMGQTRRIDALWSRAPLTGTAIRPAGLRRRGGA